MGRGAGQYWGNKTSPLKDYGKQGRLNFRSVKLYADGLSSFLTPGIPINKFIKSQVLLDPGERHC